MTANLGQYATLVADAGTLIAAASALIFTFRGRATWEPAEQDVPRGAERVGGLLIAVGIAVLWVNRDDVPIRTLTLAAIVLAIAAVVMLLIYGLFVASLTKSRQVTINEHEWKTTKIIGGFWMTPFARDHRSKNGVTAQATLLAAGNDPDRVWPPFSRALAKLCFVLCYILLVATGTIALTCASLLVEKRQSHTLPPASQMRTGAMHQTAAATNDGTPRLGRFNQG